MDMDRWDISWETRQADRATLDGPSGVYLINGLTLDKFQGIRGEDTLSDVDLIAKIKQAGYQVEYIPLAG